MVQLSKPTVGISNQKSKIPSGSISQNIKKPEVQIPTALDDLCMRFEITYEQFDQFMLACSELEQLLRNRNELGLGAGAQMERYCGIRNTSEFGRECAYAKKAAFLFLQEDLLPKLLRAIKKVNDAGKRIGIQDSSGTKSESPREGP